MENISHNNLSPTASLLTVDKLKDPKEPSAEKVILPDECGDSLWEEVLAEGHDAVPAKNISENKDLPISNND